MKKVGYLPQGASKLLHKKRKQINRIVTRALGTRMQVAVREPHKPPEYKWGDALMRSCQLFLRENAEAKIGV